jgi:hypothetical protein
MRHLGTRRLCLAFAASLLAALVMASSAFASSDHKKVQIRDDCDPASFNAAVGPDTCVGNGKTTFPDFIAELQATGAAKRWNFSRDEFGLDAGGTINVLNRGGEFHTFTEVAQFGGGCVQILNDLLGLTPVPECIPEAAPGVPLVFATTGVDPLGGTRSVGPLSAGTHLFECMIHPWMRSVAVVEGDDNGGED